MLSHAQKKPFGTIVMIKTTKEIYYIWLSFQCLLQCKIWKRGLIRFYESCMSSIHKCLQANNFNGIFSRQEFSQEVTLNKNKLILRYSILKVAVNSNSFPALHCTKTHPQVCTGLLSVAGRRDEQRAWIVKSDRYGVNAQSISV